MSILEMLLKEFDQEALTTRKMLERVPNDKYDWKPHDKSMTIGNLSTHLAELPGWITMGLNTTEMDFAVNPYQSVEINNTTELLSLFEKSLSDGRASLSSAKEEDLLPMWTLRNGEEIYMSVSKGELIRHSLSQIIHHRAQLGVYLRLLDIPIPASYGPSADEQF